MQLDIRILPGVTRDDVEGQIRTALGDLIEHIEIEGDWFGESTASPIDTPLFDALGRAVRRAYPSAALAAHAGGRRHRRPLLPAPRHPGIRIRGARANDGIIRTFRRLFHGNDERIDLDSIALTVDALDFAVRTFHADTGTATEHAWSRGGHRMSADASNVPGTVPSAGIILAGTYPERDPGAGLETTLRPVRARRESRLRRGRQSVSAISTRRLLGAAVPGRREPAHAHHPARDRRCAAGLRDAVPPRRGLRHCRRALARRANVGVSTSAPHGDLLASLGRTDCRCHRRPVRPHRACSCSPSRVTSLSDDEQLHSLRSARSPRAQPHIPGLRNWMWLRGGSLRSVRWAAQSGLKLLLGNVGDGDAADDVRGGAAQRMSTPTSRSYRGDDPADRGGAGDPADRLGEPPHSGSTTRLTSPRAMSAPRSRRHSATAASSSSATCTAPRSRSPSVSPRTPRSTAAPSCASRSPTGSARTSTARSSPTSAKPCCRWSAGGPPPRPPARPENMSAW